VKGAVGPRFSAGRARVDAVNLETWRGMSYQTVVYPPDQKNGEAIILTRRSNKLRR
jgi:hypothetical protein